MKKLLFIIFLTIPFVNNAQQVYKLISGRVPYIQVGTTITPVGTGEIFNYHIYQLNRGFNLEFGLLSNTPKLLSYSVVFDIMDNTNNKTNLVVGFKTAVRIYEPTGLEKSFISLYITPKFLTPNNIGLDVGLSHSYYIKKKIITHLSISKLYTTSNTNTLLGNLLFGVGFKIKI